MDEYKEREEIIIDMSHDLFEKFKKDIIAHENMSDFDRECYKDIAHSVAMHGDSEFQQDVLQGLRDIVKRYYKQIEVNKIRNK
jgi:uncharacterized protein YaeQ